MIPYYHFTLRSPMTPEEAQRAMALCTAADASREFKGWVDTGGFGVTYKHDGQPNGLFLRGRIRRAADGGVAITVSTRLTWFFFLFLSVVVGIPIASFVSQPNWPAGIMLAFVIALYLMVLVVFWFEATKQKRALREIFKAV